jgi:acyl-CoA thioesterase-2
MSDMTQEPHRRTPAGPMDVQDAAPELQPRDPAELLQDLLRVMDLRALDPDASGQDRFEGDSQWQPHGRVYGGQVLGQTLIAASRTVDGDRPVHSMHGYFLRPGDASAPIEFTVERLRDGRSFSARRVHALQDGRPILSMIASFQDSDEGYDHQDEMPDVPGPDELPTTADLLGHIDHPAARYWSYARPIDVRHVQAPVYLQADPERRASQAVWMRTVAPLPDDAVLHRAVLGYASDYTLLESVLRRHGRTWASIGATASLDHAMWWHRPVRADEWILYTQASPSSQGGRGLGAGRMFTQDGRLVATVAQEGMVRPPRAR